MSKKLNFHNLNSIENNFIKKDLICVDVII